VKNPSFSTVLRWTDRQCQAYLEQVRWPAGPVCPWCGAARPYRVIRKPGTRNKVGALYKCRSCRRQFSVTVGTIFERSKVPLRKWFAAIYPMCAFKRGIGAQQIQVQTKVTYKTAWLMCQRVREAMSGSGHIVTGAGQESAEVSEAGGSVGPVGGG
jgi:transposase-like protein